MSYIRSFEKIRYLPAPFRLFSQLLRKVCLWLRLFVSSLMLLFAITCSIYPGLVVLRYTLSDAVRDTAALPDLPEQFVTLSESFEQWASSYLETSHATTVSESDVAGTEWPMFGSVFFLLTAEEIALMPGGEEALQKDHVQDAIERAVEIVSSEETATWVKRKYGERYLEDDNVFYRMLLIMGLFSYEKLTGKQTYRDLMSQQGASLAKELLEAKYHLQEDYPGECYPNDVVWAAAAIQRAGKLDGIMMPELNVALMNSLNGQYFDADLGLPAYEASAQTGATHQKPRGCGNSGILIMAPELDFKSSRSWYEAHERHFWVDNRWVVGFRESPHGVDPQVMDVDSGPVVFGVGSVASAFGIGASRIQGRFDHAAPLVLEAVTFSWPTAFGDVVPALMGELAADSSCLGETALLFLMSRPVHSEAVVVPFEGSYPRSVWLMIFLYLGFGVLIVWSEYRFWRRYLRAASAPKETLDTQQD